MCGTFVGTFKYMSPERIKNRPYSYASDIWSLGLVMMECASGVYPYTELTNCIEMAQTILDCDVPELPSSQYSDELRDFIRPCLNRDPDLRQPAENLLQAPWLQKFGATSYEGCVEVVRVWIDDLTNPSSYKK
jgi:mitogen-activated protein kinase kinase 3